MNAGGKYPEFRGDWSDELDAEKVIRTFWHPDGPHSGDTVQSAALAIDTLAHYLARATFGGSALQNGPQQYRVISELRSALGRFDQVLAQMSRHAAALRDDPTLYDDRDPAGPIPGDRVRLTYSDGSTVEGVWAWDPEPGGYGALVRLDDGSVHRLMSGQVRRDVIVPAASRREAGDTVRELQGGLDAARVALGPLVEALAAAHSASAHLGHNADKSRA